MGDRDLDVATVVAMLRDFVKALDQQAPTLIMALRSLANQIEAEKEQHARVRKL